MAGVSEFVVGDTRKPLRVTIKDNDGVAVNLSGGTVRLFAVGLDSNDKPTSNPGEPTWNGVLGVFVNGTGSDGVVEFQGLGGLLAIGASRRADRYRFQVKFTDATAKVSWSSKGYFIARRAPS
jgi:hypothetical protein